VEEARGDTNFWGRLVESAVGAHLLNIAKAKNLGLHYWRQRDKEVDFVLQRGKKLVAIEVKSGARREALSGMAAFSKAFSPKHKLLVGADGISIADFLRSDLSEWL
jgi:predicted AAA+ superfamily ATPase